jgi:nitroimidazol reductase NimA-like FMN-containing flavoprotein (pyridoxamine 5'-phosphate oxidase superfamily)
VPSHLSRSHTPSPSEAATGPDSRSAGSARSRDPARPASDRVRLRRKRERGLYDRAVIHAILDEALIAHLGIVEEDGQPLVIPTLHARCGEVVYVHGSKAGRTLRALAAGAPACLTVSLLDGLVLARSAMHHSANYRSVMLLGEARSVDDPVEKLAAFEAIVEHIVPGRWREVRPPSENELKATSVLAIGIDEASAKVRSGPPVDDEEDYSLPAWAGVLPLVTEAAAPEPDPRLRAGIALPAHVSAYRRPGRP